MSLQVTVPSAVRGGRLIALRRVTTGVLVAATIAAATTSLASAADPTDRRIEPATPRSGPARPALDPAASPPPNSVGLPTPPPPRSEEPRPARPVGPLTPRTDRDACEAIIVAYEGPGTWKSLLDRIVADVTTAGDADCWVLVDSQDEAAEALAFMEDAGADLERVMPIVLETDSIWIRDYGPYHGLEGGVRVIVDHTYNRPRPNDDASTAAIAALLSRPAYDLPLVHGGSNLSTFADGQAIVADVIADENDDLSPGVIVDAFADLYGLDVTLRPKLPEHIDGHDHIDMWTLVADADTVVVSDWPLQPGSQQDLICDALAAQLAAAGRTVLRTPAHKQGGTHYTYTNLLVCNDLVIMPRFDAPVMVSFNAEAEATIEAIFPDHEVETMTCDPIAAAGGLIRTITMPVPPSTGGELPVGYVQTPLPGTVVMPGDVLDIGWISDDDEGTTTADILLSLNGGASFTFLVAAGIQDDGHFAWTVPGIGTDEARLRVRLRDADGNQVNVDATNTFVIATPPPAIGDLDGDGVVGFADLVALLSSWGPCGDCGVCPADLDGSCTVDFVDLVSLLAAWTI